MRNKSPKTLRDQVKIRLPGTQVCFSRGYSGPEAHEITVVIPRVEIRSSLNIFGRAVYTREVILNSITLVDAPRRPPGGGAAGCSAPPVQSAAAEAVSGFPLKIIYK